MLQLSEQRPPSRDTVKTEAIEDGHHTPVDNNNVINNNNNNPKEEQMSEDEEEEMEETVSDNDEHKEDKGKVNDIIKYAFFNCSILRV